MIVEMGQVCFPLLGANNTLFSMTNNTPTIVETIQEGGLHNDLEVVDLDNDV